MTDRQPTDEWIEAANCLATAASTLSSAIHEANNMLQVIGGSAEMLQMQGQVPDSVLRRAATIAEHAQRVSALLASVRDLSKVSPRRDGDTTNLIAVVNEAIDLRKHALHRGHVAISVDAGEPALVVRAGWRPTMQVVLNLLLNAEQAVLDRKGPAITIRARHEDGDVVLSVSDNGPGMPEERGPFELREFADAAPLLGLGLTAARQIVEREGGRLHFETSDSGTTALLRIPAVVSASDEADIRASG